MTIYVVEDSILLAAAANTYESCIRKQLRID